MYSFFFGNEIRIKTKDFLSFTQNDSFLVYQQKEKICKLKRAKMIPI
jgi:hypothetical protein